MRSTDGFARAELLGDIGRITLQRPQAINALTHPMITLIHQALQEWRSAGPALVMIDGEGERGLCAGGDIKAVWASAQTDGSAARALWAEEYRMNALIASYPKPVVALMHGLVLGGGVGISAHASVRVVSTNAQVGMPETIIGMVPDVGGTWLLSHAPDELGTHLALTAESVGPEEAIQAGLADLLATDAHFAALRGADSAAEVQIVLDGIRAAQPERAAVAAPTAPGAPDAALTSSSWRSECYRGDSVPEILARLHASAEPAARAAAAVIETRCPAAVTVTLRALRTARQLPNVAAALNLEYRIVCRRLLEPDLVEGIRAQVVDKDRRPRWHPADFESVDSDLVQQHFDPRPGDELGLDTAAG